MAAWRAEEAVNRYLQFFCSHHGRDDLGRSVGDLSLIVSYRGTEEELMKTSKFYSTASFSKVSIELFNFNSLTFSTERDHSTPKKMVSVMFPPVSRNLNCNELV